MFERIFCILLPIQMFLVRGAEWVIVWSLMAPVPVHVAINPSRSARHTRYCHLVVAVLTLSALHLVAVCVRWPPVFLDSHPSGRLVSKSGW